MKFILVTFSIAAVIQLSLAVFGNFRNLDKNDKYNLHREPQIRTPLSGFADTIYEGYVKQRLDNFDPQNDEYFHMRYLMNKDYLTEGSPLIIFVGGEWTISPGMLRGGHMYDMGRNLSALMIYTEHRYYGYTIPTDDLTMKNIQYLNVDQALADLAHFIQHMKENFPQIRNSGVILVGCSYSGTMVTWFMQKYPHLAQGAWSMSAPLNAQVDFVEYKEVVSHAVHEVGTETCSGKIRRAFQQLEALYESNQTTKINEMFQLCSPLDINNKLDVWNLFSDVAGPWSGVVQYYSVHDRDIEIACEQLLAVQAETDIEAYAKWIMYRFRIPEDDCYDHTYEYFMYWFNGTSWDDWVARSEWRQWLYQTCSEYGWYQSSGSENILFGKMFPVDLSLQWCEDLYDGILIPDVVQQLVDRTNVVYGAFNPKVHSVYSTHGEFDPWAPMGAHENINDESPTVILPRESHCSDISSISNRDTPEMRASKEKVFDLFKTWLGISAPYEN